MAAPTAPPIDPTWYQVTIFVLVMLLGFAGWQVRRLFVKVDGLERDAIRRHEFNRTIGRLEDKVEEGNKGTHERVDRLLELFSARGHHPHG